MLYGIRNRPGIKKIVAPKKNKDATIIELNRFNFLKNILSEPNNKIRKSNAINAKI